MLTQPLPLGLALPRAPPRSQCLRLVATSDAAAAAAAAALCVAGQHKKEATPLRWRLQTARQ